MPELTNIMISSRCESPIELHGETKTYSDLRREIKKTIEAWRYIDAGLFSETQKNKELKAKPPYKKNLIDKHLFEKPIFEVWINEDTISKPGDRTVTDICLRQVSRSHILIVLYNGDSGWVFDDRDVGICHKELAQAWNSEPGKIRLIKLPLCDPDVAKLPHNQRFQDYVERLEIFWKKAKNGDEAKELVLEVLHDSVIEMIKLGKRETARFGPAMGDTLDWTLKEFAARKEAMESVIHSYLETMAHPLPYCPNCGLFIRLMGQLGNQQPRDYTILSLFHAIPSSMSIAAAREMVGRPFYRDYEYNDYLTGVKNDIEAIGPIHFIGCHKNVTETQVRNLVGHPDIILIPGPFGVYMLDTVQHTQLIFLADCRDETCTRNSLGRFFGWLRLTGKSSMIIENAESRKRIVSIIGDEYK